MIFSRIFLVLSFEICIRICKPLQILVHSPEMLVASIEAFRLCLSYSVKSNQNLQVPTEQKNASKFASRLNLKTFKCQYNIEVFCRFNYYLVIFFPEISPFQRYLRIKDSNFTVRFPTRIFFSLSGSVVMLKFLSKSFRLVKISRINEAIFLKVL